MSMKMKGLLKGLRYISTIFDEEEETEMQIGFPTDVKHVAHIGWDGPTANSPSWINQFKDGEGGGGGGGAVPNGNEVDQQNASRTKESRPQAQERRVSAGSDPPLESPSRRRSDKPKGSRRATSASSSATDSPKKSSTDSRTKQVSAGESDQASASTKTSRRKKPKGSSSGGTSTSTSSSSRTSNKSKPTTPQTEMPHYSDPGIGQRRLKGKDTSCQGSALKTSSEQEDQNDMSRGIQAV
ncbi:CRIB domain-containing protein RIC1 [Bienertia sinuspersici]